MAGQDGRGRKSNPSPQRTALDRLSIRSQHLQLVSSMWTGGILVLAGLTVRIELPEPKVHKSD
jgi:hypothetical protein